MKLQLPKFIKRAIINLAKSLDPRYMWALTGQAYERFGVSNPYNYKGNLEAIRYNTWAYVCIRKIANCIAGLPIKFFIGYDEDNARTVTDHPLVDLIYRPNPLTTHRDLWYQSIWYMLATGVCYWAVEETNKVDNTIIPGRSKIWLLPSDKIQIIPDAKNGIAGYLLNVNGTTIKYSTNEVIAFRDFNPIQPFYPLSLMTVGESSIKLDHYAHRYNIKYFENDGSAGVILETDQPYDAATNERILSHWAARHQGVDKSHNIDILWYGLKYKNPSKSPKDLDYVNLMRLTREEIISLFGVPPATVGLFEYANYANSQIQNKMLWENTILPLIQHIESTLNELAFPMFTDDELWIKFDTSSIMALQENYLEKSQIAAIQWQNNIKTQNEIRADFDLEPVEGGDVFNRDLNKFYGVSTGENETALSISDYTAKTITAKTRNAKWLDNEAFRVKLESRFMRRMSSFFNEQLKRVLDDIEDYDPDTHVRLSIDSLYNTNDEENILENYMAPLIRQSFIESGRRAFEQIKSARTMRKDNIPLQTIFDVENPNIEKWIQANTAQFVTKVSKTTRERIKELVDQSNDEGWPMRQLSKEIRGLFRQFNEVRSLRIAQTEMGMAMNNGSLEGYKQAGVTRKAWLATPDDRVRPEHKEAGEQPPIGINEKFIVGGEPLECPGDMNGSPENVINCRCSIEAVESDTEEE